MNKHEYINNEIIPITQNIINYTPNDNFTEHKIYDKIDFDKLINNGQINMLYIDIQQDDKYYHLNKIYDFQDVDFVTLTCLNNFDNICYELLVNIYYKNIDLIKFVLDNVHKNIFIEYSDILLVVASRFSTYDICILLSNFFDKSIQSYYYDSYNYMNNETIDIFCQLEPDLFCYIETRANSFYINNPICYQDFIKIINAYFYDYDNGITKTKLVNRLTHLYRNDYNNFITILITSLKTLQCPLFKFIAEYITMESCRNNILTIVLSNNITISDIYNKVSMIQIEKVNELFYNSITNNKFELFKLGIEYCINDKEINIAFDNDKCFKYVLKNRMHNYIIFFKKTQLYKYKYVNLCGYKYYCKIKYNKNIYNLKVVETFKCNIQMPNKTIDDCCICFEQIENNGIETKCKHYYCSKCYYTYYNVINTNKKCCTCRRDISHKDSILYYNSSI